MIGTCLMCGIEKKLDKHHLDYKKNITIKICRSCHRRIHMNKDYIEFRPKDHRKTLTINIYPSDKKLFHKLFGNSKDETDADRFHKLAMNYPKLKNKVK